MGAATEVSTTLLKSIHLLRTIGRSQTSLSLAQLVSASGMSKTICHRLLQTLRQENLIERDEASGRYRIGFGLVELAASALGQNALRIAANRHLRLLASVTGDAAMLFVPYGAHAMCIDRMDGDYPVKAAGVEIGGLLPIHTGGAPFAMLSNLPRAVVDALLNDALPPSTASSDADPVSIRRRIEAVRRAGFAVGDGDAVEFVVAVGAAICGQDGEVIGGISVGGIKQRYDTARIAEVSALVMRAGDAISAGLRHVHAADHGGHTNSKGRT